MGLMLSIGHKLNIKRKSKTGDILKWTEITIL